MRKSSLMVPGCLLAALATTACAGPSQAPHPVATLQITGGVPVHLTTLRPILARVSVGQKFSVIVNTTDGPLEWRLTRTGQPAIVQGQGNAVIGSCGSPPAVGCREPDQYTFVARAKGATTMEWTEYGLCSGQPARTCPAVIQPVQVTVT
jgi:hypothetical protein